MEEINYWIVKNFKKKEILFIKEVIYSLFSYTIRSYRLCISILVEILKMGLELINGPITKTRDPFLYLH